jgi:hypothetical protein
MQLKDPTLLRQRCFVGGVVQGPLVNNAAIEKAAQHIADAGGKARTTASRNSSRSGVCR